MDLPVDMIASSAGWGVEKPAPGFFERLVGESGFKAPEIVYVGDRLDNDVLPAVAAGMHGVFVRRGPWGLVHARWREVSKAHAVIDALDELPSLLSEWRASVP
jgi:FMN phosphatase YigB (HAD superfamily)